LALDNSAEPAGARIGARRRSLGAANAIGRAIDHHQGNLDLDPAVAERCEQRLALARTHMAAGFYHWLEAGRQFAAIKSDLTNRH
jgi:hypothetical protein